MLEVQGFHQQPEHENFRQLLRAPEDDAMVSEYVVLMTGYDVRTCMAMCVCRCSNVQQK